MVDLSVKMAFYDVLWLFQALWPYAMGIFGAPSTARKWTTVWQHWLDFLRLCDFADDLVLPTILYVRLWIGYLFNKTLAFNSVRSYLYSLVNEVKYEAGVTLSYVQTLGLSTQLWHTINADRWP